MKKTNAQKHWDAVLRVKKDLESTGAKVTLLKKRARLARKK